VSERVPRDVARALAEILVARGGGKKQKRRRKMKSKAKAG
jgi:hypothetical protein